jgi:hypothetical protein
MLKNKLSGIGTIFVVAAHILVQPSMMAEDNSRHGRQVFAMGIRLAYPESNPDDNNGLLHTHTEDGMKISVLEDGTFINEGEAKEVGAWRYKDGRLKLTMDDKLFMEFKVENNFSIITPLDLPEEGALTELADNLKDEIETAEGALNKLIKDLADAIDQATAAEQTTLEAVAKADAAEGKATAAEQKTLEAVAKADAAEGKATVAEQKTLEAVAKADAAEGKATAAEEKTLEAVAKADAAEGKATVAEQKTLEAVAKADAAEGKATAAEENARLALAKVAGALKPLLKMLANKGAAEDQADAELEGKKAGIAHGAVGLAEAARLAPPLILTSQGFTSQSPNAYNDPGEIFGDVIIRYQDGKPNFTPVEKPKSTAASTVNEFLNNMNNKSAGRNEAFLQQQQLARAQEAQRVASQQAKARADEARRTATWNKRNSDYTTQQTAQRAILKRQEAAREAAAAAARAAAAQRQIYSTPRYSTPRYSTPRYSTPRYSTPRYSTPSYNTYPRY